MPTREKKLLSFPRFGNKTKHGVKFRRSKSNKRKLGDA